MPDDDHDIVNAPARGEQLGHIEAEANARHGLPTGTTPAPPEDADKLLDPEPVRAADLDPDQPVDAVAGDLNPDAIVED